jgi:hypothetical protein
MTIKRRRGVLETGLMGQLEFTVACDDCSADMRDTVSGWNQNCQDAIDSAKAAGWNLGDTDYYADLCPRCVDNWKEQQEAYLWA